MSCGQNNKREKRFIELTCDNLDVDTAASSTMDLAKKIFGFHHRDWQGCAIQALVRKQDLFVKASTGAGKSLVFQSMIASKPNGIVLVIVPLKSLMDDQVS